MKIVNTKSMVAHLFANQSQYEARTSTGNFYFVDKVCNSYGSHFVAAVHHGDTVLLNSNNYSVTTASHLSELQSACRHLTTYSVANPMAGTKPDHRANFRGLVTEYEKEILRASRARVHNSVAYADSMLNAANSYADRFKIGNRLKPIALENAKATAAKRTAKDNAAAKRAYNARIKKEALHKAALIQTEEIRSSAWRAGAYHHTLFRIPVMCRLNTAGDTVQTSQGASFPASHARKWIGFVLSTMRKGQSWERNGSQIELGAFQIDRITPDVLIAGCHTVERAEVERLELLLKSEVTS